MVHGDEHVARAERASSALFGEDISTLPADEVLAVFDDVPSSEVTREPDGWKLASLLVSAQLAKSMADAARLITGGGIYVNNRRITDQRARLEVGDAIDGRLFVLRKGAKQNHVVKIAAR